MAIILTTLAFFVTVLLGVTAWRFVCWFFRTILGIPPKWHQVYPYTRKDPEA